MNAKTRMTAVGGAVVLAVVLSACAGQEGEPAASSPTSAAAESEPTAPTVDESHNAADVTFTQNMVVHHEGAILMADLAGRTATTAEVKALADRIAAAQEPEILEMQSWLVAWDEDSAADADMEGMDMEGMDMGGLSQQEAMVELKAATGVEFDRRFLELMIEHHEGAIEMSETQLSDGTNPRALELAESIIEAQKSEITEMEQLLQGL